MTDALLSSLTIPTAFIKYDDAELDPVTRKELDTWKHVATYTIQKLHEDLLGASTKPADLLQSQRVQVAAVASSFVYDAPWTNERIQEYTSEVLNALKPTSALVTEVLSAHIRPLFKANPHPHLNMNTGRKLSTPAGGSGAVMDTYDHQPWKAEPAVGSVLRWCIEQCSADSWDKVWHLLVPAVMTLVDDYEVRWKIVGFTVVHHFLNSAPPGLLSRTGVDQLLYQSLQTALTHVHDPLSSTLLRITVKTTLELISKNTSPGTEVRVNRLFALLGDGIIGTVWVHAARAPDVLRTSFEVLPSVVDMLGIGTVRYLKAIIPQLLIPLQPPPDGLDLDSGMETLRIPALKALRVVIGVCAVRMEAWKGQILASVAKAWVYEVDPKLCSKNVDSVKREEWKTELKQTCKALREACPRVVEDEFSQLLKMDDMFIRLLNASELS